MSCVVAESVRKSHNGRLALDGFNLEIPHGCILGLLGQNGAGKTTFLQALVGLLPVEGHLHVLGRDPWRDRTDIMRDVSYVADVSIMPRWLRVSQAFDYMEGVHPAFDRPKAEIMLATTGIRAHERVQELSKGSVAQLQLALAMSVNAKLVVLDEPTLGVDIVYRNRFFEMLLERFAEGDQTIVIATHDVDEIQHVLTHMAFMHAGRIVLQCTAEEYENRFVEVHVHPDHLEIARELSPLHERSAMAGGVFMYDGGDRERLSLLGDLTTPSLGAVFDGVISNETRRAR